MEFYIQLTCLTIFPVRFFIFGLDWLRNTLDVKRTRRELLLVSFVFISFVSVSLLWGLNSLWGLGMEFIKSCFITILIFGSLLSIEYICKK